MMDECNDTPPAASATVLDSNDEQASMSTGLSFMVCSLAITAGNDLAQVISGPPLIPHDRIQETKVTLGQGAFAVVKEGFVVFLCFCCDLYLYLLYFLFFVDFFSLFL